MARFTSVEVRAVDLPFRKPFKHAAAERNSSYSLFVSGTTDAGAVGFGECLPREYVTGESRDGVFELLRERVLPRLLEEDFTSYEAAMAFLERCDGKAPADWVDPNVPQTAAWCAVDLMLLDAFGRVFERPALGTRPPLPKDARYSGVASAEAGASLLKTALKLRLYGIREVKAKVGAGVAADDLLTLRRVLGRRGDIRVDANMEWSVEQAFRSMSSMAELGIESFEQPIAADDLEGLARLVRETRLGVMADESFSDRESLQTLVERKACTAVNVRVSKCGGLVAARARCREALAAGLVVQIGCQVGESSLLSAAHLELLAQVPEARYLEGCFGLLLLREDPVSPVLQFGWGGRAPAPPGGSGLGVSVDQSALDRYTVKREKVHG